MYVRGYLQGSENGRVVTIGTHLWQHMFPSLKLQYPLELLMTISYENMILNKSMILHLYNYAKEKVLKWTPLCKMQLGLKPEVNLSVLAPG